MYIEPGKQWPLDHPGTDLLTWAHLANFLDTRSRALETGPIASRSIQNTTNQFESGRSSGYLDRNIYKY